MNPIQQASQVPLHELLLSVPADARLTVNEGEFSTRYIPVGRLCHDAAEALTSLRSLQKEVEGVEPVGWRHKQYGHIQWRSYDMTPEVCDRYTNSGQWDLLYTADQLRTAVAAALGRGAGQPEWRATMRDLLNHIEQHTCMHEDTYRGGAIWEICRECGAKWADDQGGKPEFAEPAYVERARDLLAAPSPEATQPTQAEAPSERARVGDSRFESWFGQEFDPKNKGTKQQMREAYEAGMNDSAALATQQAVQGERAPEFNGWYCAHCQRGVDGSEVTFREQHTVCGHVITNDRPPAPGQVERDRETHARLCVKQAAEADGSVDYSDACHDCAAAIRAARSSEGGGNEHSR